LYGDQNYHDGPTYILARSLHMAIPLIVAPLFIARALTLRQTWGQLGLRTKVTRVFIVSVSMVILVLYILSFWTASSWLLQ
jgi:small neutral amino acid transporter SnatA (MarC family)